MSASSSRTLATGRRVLAQLRHDPRTIVLMLAVPCVLETLLRLIYEHHRGPSTAPARRCWRSSPLRPFSWSPPSHCFASASAAHSSASCDAPGPSRAAARLRDRLRAPGRPAGPRGERPDARPAGLNVAGPAAMVVLLAVSVALLGMGLGLLASAFARSEFQVVQFMPAIILPQLLLWACWSRASGCRQGFMPSRMSCRCPMRSTGCIT